MPRRRPLFLKFSASFLAVAWLAAGAFGEEESAAVTDPSQAGAEFALQGEYSGEVKTDDGPKKVGVQIIALGQGKFHAVAFVGGLPGDGWEGGERVQTDGELIDGAAVFKNEKGSGRAKDGVLTAMNSGGQAIADFKRVIRESPTLGAKPPEGAVVLFDGTSADQFEGGRLTDDGLLMVGTSSKQSFRDFEMHIEFRTPFMPTATGQARGNSGVYLQDRYEIQVLDSFGLEGKNNECGGIYSVQDPRLNMCFPPLSWQTYDVEMTGARFDDSGKKTKNAVVTVRHNGVKIYDQFELPTLTPGGAGEESPGVGPLKLQDHSNPVTFRNIWVVEK
jgi:hypothetical protein